MASNNGRKSGPVKKTTPKNKGTTPPTSQAQLTEAPDPNPWALTNWSEGPVTLLQAFGIKKGKVKFTPLKPNFTTNLLAQTQTTSSGGGGGGGGGTGHGGGGGGGGVGVTGAGTSQTDAMTAILKDLGAPVTQANLNSLNAWYAHENDHSWPPGVQNNMFNTTLPMPGATNWPGNNIGIKQYVSMTQGAQANALTIMQGYPGILAALKSGNGLCGTGLAGEFLTWSGQGYSSVC